MCSVFGFYRLTAGIKVFWFWQLLQHKVEHKLISQNGTIIDYTKAPCLCLGLFRAIH